MSSTSRRPDLHWSLPAKLQYIQPPKTRLIRNAANCITVNDQRSVQANIVKRERYLKLIVTNCIMTIPPCLRHKIQFCENSLLIYTQTPSPHNNTALINEIMTEKICLNVIWTLNNIRSKSGWLQKCGHLINLLLQIWSLKTLQWFMFQPRTVGYMNTPEMSAKTQIIARHSFSTTKYLCSLSNNFLLTYATGNCFPSCSCSRASLTPWFDASVRKINGLH